MRWIKLLLRWLGAIIVVPLSNLVGLVVGATYGGNYDVNFYFASVAGYEAWGVVGAQICGAVGLALAAWLVVPTRWQLEKKIFWVTASISTLLTLTCLLYIDTYATTPWVILLLPIGSMAALIYGYYFVGSKTRYRLYGALLGGSIILSVFLVFTLRYNYACLRFATICLVEAPAIVVTVDQSAAIAGEPIKFVSQLKLYGDIHTLEQYCSDIELFWDFGDGTTASKSGCDNYPPNMQPTTRGWVKHTYVQGGQYTTTVTLRYREHAIFVGQVAVVVQ